MPKDCRTPQDRRALISRVLPHALGLPKAERASYLDGVCDDSRTRRKIHELIQNRDELRDYLDAHQDSHSRTTTLESGSTSSGDPETPQAFQASARPETIGPYRILDVLGEGGMGIVYLAEQSEPVQRRLALKLIHRNLSGSVSMARFKAERQAMARLSHPNIA